MFGPNYDFCEQTWFGSSEKISEYQIQSTDRGSEALNLVVCDNGAYPQYELLPLEFKHKKMPETGYLDPYKKKKKRKKHSVKKQLLQDEAILSGLQTVIDLCGLLDRCELKTGQDKIVCTPTNSKKVDAEIDCKVADSKSRSSCESKSHKSVCIKVNKLSPYHAVLAHVSENSRKQQTEPISPANKHKSNIPKLINRPAASSKQSAINYSVGVDSYTPYFQEVTVNPCAACGKKDSKDSAGSKGSKDKVSKRNSDKDLKSKNSKNSKKSSGSNLSISCIPPVQVPACGSTSCTECKKFEKMLQKYEKKNKSCECRILRSRNNGAKSECLGENQTKLFVPERSCSEQQGVIMKRKNLNCKHSRNSIPLVQPVLGTCNEGECNIFGKSEEAHSVSYAYVKITEFNTYQTYEVMKGTPKKPSYMPSLIRELFVTRKEEYLNRPKKKKSKCCARKKKSSENDVHADRHPPVRNSNSSTSNKSNRGGVTFSKDACIQAKDSKSKG